MTSNYKILDRKEISRDDWDNLVLQCDSAWLWHTWDAIEAVGTWRGHEEKSIGIKDASTNRLVALFPLVLTDSGSKFGIELKKLFSLGGAAISPNLGTKSVTSIYDLLKEFTHNVLLDTGAYRFDVQFSPLAPDNLRSRINPAYKLNMEETSKLTWMTNLSPSVEEIRKSYSQSARRKLKKSSCLDISIREASTPKDLDLYYGLHTETYKRSDMLPHPFEYFQIIFDRFIPKGLARIVFAEERGKVIAAQNSAIYKNGAYYWTGAANEAGLSGGSNWILFDNQIAFAKTKGCQLYETGWAYLNTDVPKDRGLSQFKGSFGCELYPLWEGTLRNSSRKFRMLKAAHEVFVAAR